MKKSSLSVILNVPDTFECGQCNKCHLATSKYYEPCYGSGEYRYKCVLGYTVATCPLSEVREDVKVN